MISELKGFRMPAEWEPHQGTWLTFPHDESHWPGNFGNIPAMWARIVKELEAGEEVHVAIHDDETERVAKEEFKKAGVKGEKVFLHRIPNDFSWARDHGPIFVRNAEGERKIAHWQYNAWGKQWEHRLDEKIPTFVSKILDVPEVNIPMVLEGGSIDVNGRGTLMTTESCLLNQNRNEKLSKQDIEQHLKDALGVTNVVWLGGEIVGDDTSGHIDDLARFVGPNSIVTMVERDSKDENYAALQQNYETLRSAVNEEGKPFEVIPIMMPDPVMYEGKRLPASYANFYIGNTVILLPVFNCPQDQAIIDILRKCFQERRVVPIDARELVWGFGTFHCLSQQIIA